jgi:hypothetical protein
MMPNQCCCNQDDVCIYHVIIYLFQKENWLINFNGTKDCKVKKGAYPLKASDRKCIVKKYAEYRKRPRFREICRNTPYGALHCRSDQDPNTCCKCQHCIDDNLRNAIYKFKVQTGEYVKVKISNECSAYVDPIDVHKLQYQHMIL